MITSRYLIQPGHCSYIYNPSCQVLGSRWTQKCRSKKYKKTCPLIKTRLTKNPQTEKSTGKLEKDSERLTWKNIENTNE